MILSKPIFNSISLRNKQIYSSQGAKQKFQLLEKKGKSMMSVRKIRQFDEGFDPKAFAEEAQEIYIGTHKALAE